MEDPDDALTLVFTLVLQSNDMTAAIPEMSCSRCPVTLFLDRINDAKFLKLSGSALTVAPTG